MKIISVFQTTDGTLFQNEQDAEKHEMSFVKARLIDEFLDSDSNGYTGLAHDTIVRNSLVNWEIWKSKNEITPK
jgi:hypothetical protein